MCASRDTPSSQGHQRGGSAADTSQVKRQVSRGWLGENCVHAEGGREEEFALGCIRQPVSQKATR